MAGDYRDKSDLLYLLGLSSNWWKLSFCNCLIKCELLFVFMGRDEPGARLTAHGRNLLRESFLVPTLLDRFLFFLLLHSCHALQKQLKGD